MNEFEKKIKNISGKIRLSTLQKHVLRESLLSYMAYHPLPESMQKQKSSAIALFFSYGNFSNVSVIFSTWKGRSGAALAALMLIVGIPAFAERSVPGDVLYLVKVRVNEEVLSQLSLGSYEKLEWETRRVERRIAEARLLAKEGKLTEEVEAQITETVKEHTASAQKELASLRESDADGAEVAQVEFELALDVQSAMLATDHASSSEPASRIGVLASAVVDAKATLVADTRTSDSESSYDRFSQRADESATRARDLFNSLEGTLTESERTQIERRLSSIDVQIVAVRANYGTTSTHESVKALKLILRDSEKVIAFMTNIEVRRSVALEILVPEKLTLEERTSVIKSLKDELEAGVALAESRLADLDESFQSETTPILAEVRNYLIVIGRGALSEEALPAAEAAEDEARKRMRDLLNLTASEIEANADADLGISAADLGGVTLPVSTDQTVE